MPLRVMQTSKLQANVLKKKDMANILQSNNAPLIKLISVVPGQFKDKELDLVQPASIGRQTNPNIGPSSHNGLFESKLLSRSHAIIYWENGKVWIRDTKSSNGTFLNGRRLSEEGSESQPFSLNDGDTLTFGTDALAEDGTVTIPCISCHVSLIFPEPASFQPEKAISANKNTNLEVSSLISQSEKLKEAKELLNESLASVSLLHQVPSNEGELKKEIERLKICIKNLENSDETVYRFSQLYPMLEMNLSNHGELAKLVKSALIISKNKEMMGLDEIISELVARKVDCTSLKAWRKTCDIPCYALEKRKNEEIENNYKPKIEMLNAELENLKKENELLVKEMEHNNKKSIEEIAELKRSLEKSNNLKKELIELKEQTAKKESEAITRHEKQEAEMKVLQQELMECNENLKKAANYSKGLEKELQETVEKNSKKVSEMVSWKKINDTMLGILVVAMSVAIGYIFTKK